MVVTRKKLGGLAFSIALFFTAYFGTLFMLVPFAPLVLVAPHLLRMVCGWMSGLWFMNTVAMLELFCGIKIVISGDKMRSDERSMIIMNHRTRLDWMFFWSCIWRQSDLSTERIVLKSPLKRVPGAGWAMQFLGYVFIHRKWEQDKQILCQFIDYHKDTKQTTQLLLFPEGTDFTEKTRKMSDRFAQKTGVEPYDYVLHPRTTGFAFLAQYMRKEEMLDAVYDVTLAYPQNLPQDELAIVRGEFPREIHFHIKKHPIQTLPITEDGLREWCVNKWKDKEEKLKLFYTQTKQLGETVKYDNNTVMLCFAVLYWTLFLICVCLLFYWFSFIRWYMLLVTVIYVIGERVFGGFELLQIRIHNYFWSHRVKSD